MRLSGFPAPYLVLGYSCGTAPDLSAKTANSPVFPAIKLSDVILYLKKIIVKV